MTSSKRAGARRSSDLPSILVLHGPNLNVLGRREPAVYGYTTLAEIDESLAKVASLSGFRVTCRQTNREGELVDWIQEAPGRHQGIIINAAAYTHTSIAIRDALAAVGVPAIEVHLTNVAAREEFRHASMLAAVCVGTITGFGPAGYRAALLLLIERLERQPS